MSALTLAPSSVPSMAFDRGFTTSLISQHPTRNSLQILPGRHDDSISLSSTESSSSNASLPTPVGTKLTRNYSYQDTGHASLTTATSSRNVDDVTAGRISHWAVSFDRLLDDPLGVKYFTEFLRKEFSEENILFWEACEELKRLTVEEEDKLKAEVAVIYERFLCDDAPMLVNIDSQARQLAEESLKSPPHPDVFRNQQHQIYTLMRLDSYSRFIKSTLYRQCMVSEMEGRPLPLELWSPLSSESFQRRDSQSMGSGTLRRDSKKEKGSKKGIFKFKHRSKSHREMKSKSLVSRQSSGTGESSGSESSFPVSRAASLPGNSAAFPDPSRVCHVKLWNNTSTVLYPRKAGNVTVAEALGDLCENRGVRLSAVDVYLAEEYAIPANGKPKTALSLDVDVSMLASQSIVLERRSLFRLDMLPAKRSVGVKAQASKSIAEVLKPVLKKYGLDIRDVVVKDCNREHEVSLDNPVSTLDEMRIIVEDKPDMNAERGEKEKGLETKDGSTKRRSRYDKNANNLKTSQSEEPTQPESDKQRRKDQSLKRRSRALSKPPTTDKRETEALLELMSSLQGRKLDNQRGLISQADLELPEFLKLKPINDEAIDNEICRVTNSSTASKSSEPVVEMIVPYAVSPVVNASSGPIRMLRLSSSGRKSPVCVEDDEDSMKTQEAKNFLTPNCSDQSDQSLPNDDPAGADGIDVIRDSCAFKGTSSNTSHPNENLSSPHDMDFSSATSNQCTDDALFDPKP